MKVLSVAKTDNKKVVTKKSPQTLPKRGDANQVVQAKFGASLSEKIAMFEAQEKIWSALVEDLETRVQATRFFGSVNEQGKSRRVELQVRGQGNPHDQSRSVQKISASFRSSAKDFAPIPPAIGKLEAQVTDATQKLQDSLKAIATERCRSLEEVSEKLNFLSNYLDAGPTFDEEILAEFLSDCIEGPGAD